MPFGGDPYAAPQMEAAEAAGLLVWPEDGLDDDVAPDAVGAAPPGAQLAGQALATRDESGFGMRPRGATGGVAEWRSRRTAT